MRRGEKIFYRSISGVIYRGEVSAERSGGSYDLALYIGGKEPVMVPRVRPPQFWKQSEEESDGL